MITHVNRIPLWRARTEALTYLRRKRGDRIAVIEEMFELIDRCVGIYESHAATDSYANICGLTLLKAKHLALGAYSLSLDGLGQESGALLRPFIEYTELLTYFRRFPKKVSEAENGRLPSAGERAKAIDGVYKELRQHLNQHASHGSYSRYSLGHLMDPVTGNFKKMQQMVPEVLDRNVRDFAVQLFLLLHEGAVGLKPLKPRDLIPLATECDDMKARLIEAFGLVGPPDPA